MHIFFTSGESIPIMSRVESWPLSCKSKRRVNHADGRENSARLPLSADFFGVTEASLEFALQPRHF